MWPNDDIIVLSQGRQEDAEEFLCCILSGLHEEMVAAQTAVRYQGRKRGEMKEGGEGGGEGDWEQVGPKNKSTITRQVGSKFIVLSENTYSSKYTTCLCKSGSHSNNL